MPRYFRILHLKKRFVIHIYFKFFSFFSLSLVINITFGFFMESGFVFISHVEILLTSPLVMLFASLIYTAFIMITKSSAIATVFLWLVYPN